MKAAITFEPDNEKIIRFMSDDPYNIEKIKPAIRFNCDAEAAKLFGTPIIVEILAYGNDGKNEGLACRVQSIKPEMQKILDEIEYPVIIFSIDKENPDSFLTMESKVYSIPYTCKGFFQGVS
jgi:hypothetical protein